MRAPLIGDPVVLHELEKIMVYICQQSQHSEQDVDIDASLLASIYENMSKKLENRNEK